MTDQTPRPTETPQVAQYRDEVVRPLVNGLKGLAVEVRRNSAAHGFATHGDRLRHELRVAEETVETLRLPDYAFEDDDEAGAEYVAEQEARLARAQEDYGAYVGNRLMLIAGEVTEAHEEVRNGLDFSTRYTEKGKPEGLGSELADILIRLLDTAEELEVDIVEELLIKMPYNYGRPAMHGRKF